MASLPHACRARRRADRRRRLCRPRAGDRAAPGARAARSRSRSPIRRSAAPAPMRARPPSWRRRGGCSRPSASGTRSRTRRSRSSTWSITDSRLQDAVRPVFLTFDGDVAAGRAVRPHGRERPAARCADRRRRRKRASTAALPRRAFAGPFEAACGASRRIDVSRSSDGGTVAARLLVAADGARSAIRERAGIASHGWTYGQSGIVTTVAHERDHHGRAEEHFLPAGPFAILPLERAAARRSSGPRKRRRPSASSRCPTPNSTPSSSGASACISARSRRSARAAPIRSALRWRAPSSPSGSRWSATPPTSSIRSPGRGSIWGSRTSPRSPR